jgi:hypothetical protein
MLWNEHCERMDEMPLTTRKEAEARILEKAGKDDAFRKQLIDGPTALVARELGVELPSGFTVTVVQETANHIFIVLPPRSVPDGELSDTDLDRVAGGAMDPGKGGAKPGGQITNSINPITNSFKQF